MGFFYCDAHAIFELILMWSLGWFWKRSRWELFHVNRNLYVSVGTAGKKEFKHLDSKTFTQGKWDFSYGGNRSEKGSQKLSPVLSKCSFSFLSKKRGR